MVLRLWLLKTLREGIPILDAVVKVGGSLAAEPEKLRLLCAQLSEAFKTCKLLLVPGGGEFADAVRSADRRFSLSPEVAHRMAILGMDQYGLLLSHFTPNCVPVSSFDAVTQTLDSGKLPIFLSADLMFSCDPLENSWDVTSDSIATYIATQLHAHKVVLVKSVDGIYNKDPIKYSDAQLLPKVSARELIRYNSPMGVDKNLPELLLDSNIDCCVVNGFFPLRLKAILEGKETICTKITSS